MPQIYRLEGDGIRQVNPDNSFAALGLGSSMSSSSMMSSMMGTDVFYEMPDVYKRQVLSHITKQLCPNILHLFANTTNEYPETLRHIQWEVAENHTNIITVLPIDVKGEMWNFKKVVERYGFPMFSKRVSNAIRTYQHARTPQTLSLIHISPLYSVGLLSIINAITHLSS